MHYHICKSEELSEMNDEWIVFCQSYDKLAVKPNMYVFISQSFRASFHKM